MLLSVHDNVEQVRRQLRKHEREQVPFAASLAINDVAEDVRDNLKDEIQRVFDRPTRFVSNSFFVFKSNKKSLTAFVQFKGGPAGTPGERVLVAHVFGGPRVYKRHELRLVAGGFMQDGEFAVPGERARLDVYGNQRSSEIVQVLSALKTSTDPYQNRTVASRRRNKRSRDFFVPSRRSGRLKPGVYERLSNGRVRPVIRFVRPPFYLKRLRWFEISKKTVSTNIKPHFKARLAQALKTARRRRRAA